MSMGSNPMFPIIFYNYATSYLINLINITSAHKKLVIEIPYTKKTITLLKIFKKNNFIQNYLIFKKKNKYFIKIYPFYFKNLKIIKTFRLVSKPSRTFYISLKAIKLLSKRSGSSIYLISTSKGILNHLEARNEGMAGFLLGFYYL